MQVGSGRETKQEVGPLCLPKCHHNRVSHITNNNKPSHKLGKSKSHPLQIPACAATSVQTATAHCATAISHPCLPP